MQTDFHLGELFTNLWHDYTSRLCPSAARVHSLLQEGMPLINDHIALRTFNLSKLNLEKLAAPFLACGFKKQEDYEFTSKKLKACYFQHPDPNIAKVFISELEVEKCSESLQKVVQELVAQADANMFKNSHFIYHGKPWELDFATYQMLAKESEYAAWVAAHGFGANHFTVDVLQLEKFKALSNVNSALKQAGFTINDAGGEVKGSPSVFLEQSSTMADKVFVKFSDGMQIIPGGFYEFAKRYAMPNGALYQGFVEASANKIFESTDN